MFGWGIVTGSLGEEMETIDEGRIGNLIVKALVKIVLARPAITVSFVWWASITAGSWTARSHWAIRNDWLLNPGFAFVINDALAAGGRGLWRGHDAILLLKYGGETGFGSVGTAQEWNKSWELPNTTRTNAPNKSVHTPQIP